MDNRIKMGKISWIIDSETLEGIVITILNLAKKISTHRGQDDISNNSTVVCFLLQII